MNILKSLTLRVLLCGVVFCSLTRLSYATVPNTFTNGTIADADDVNANFDYFENKFSVSSGHDHNGVNSRLLTTLGTVTSGTLSGTSVWQGSVIDELYGGTGQNAYATGDIVFATKDNVIARLAMVSTPTRYLSNTATNDVTGGVIPGWAQVNLTNGVTGLLPISSGGTGYATADAALTALFPTWNTVSHIVLYTSSSGNFTVPSGVTTVYVTLVAGGGGGGTATGGESGNGGGGGGGQALIRIPYTVVPTNTYAYSVGAGGLGATSLNTDGADGNDTTFGTGTVLTANKGLKGLSGTNGTTGGLGGKNTAAAVYVGGTIIGISGGDGAAGSGGVYSGGGGGGSMFGIGGNGGNNGSSDPGDNGTGYGSGGGGASKDSTQGGNGAGGVVLIEY